VVVTNNGKQMGVSTKRDIRADRYARDDTVTNGYKGGDTLSSRHVSSCDITRSVGMLQAV
jgi:hypothetical protein